ncbi:MAG: LysR family transcriptional regulator [Mangrovicoccus sp.]
MLDQNPGRSLDLNALREFSAVIEEGSFAAAARRLDTPKSTVSKRIQDLEAALGVRLIERTTRKLRLTAEGALVLSRAERILADADEIARSLTAQSHRVSGHLRIAAPLLFGQIYMGHVAAACRASYPDLTLEIVLTDSQPDLVEDGFDGALRIGASPDSGIASVDLGSACQVLVAAPGALPQPPQHPKDLTDQPSLLSGVGLIQTWLLTDGKTEITTRVTGALTLTSHSALRDAAVAGAGIAFLPSYLVAEDLRSGRLERILPDWTSPAAQVSFVYPNAQALTQRLRAFMDIIGAAMHA